MTTMGLKKSINTPPLSVNTILLLPFPSSPCLSFFCLAMALPSHLFLFLLLLLSGCNIGSSTVFIVENRCSYTVWPATLSGNGAAILGDGGFTLPPGSSRQITAPSGWSGRLWARTSCNFDSSGSNGQCATGDCGGALHCTAGGVPPVTLAEFTLGTPTNNKDFYDVSLVDGYNVEMSVKATGGTGDCQNAGCVADLNANCPSQLQVRNNNGGGAVVACKSACAAFNTAEFCCTGDHSTPATCGPTQYSEMFKRACPTAYSYAYDDASSTCTCSGSDYLITFCPSR